MKTNSGVKTKTHQIKDGNSQEKITVKDENSNAFH